jgi:membrane dipeptidase
MRLKLTRRDTIKALSAAALSTNCLSFPAAANEERLQDAVDLLRKHPSIDLHCHPGMFPRRGHTDHPGDDFARQTVADMHEGQMWGGFFSLIGDSVLLELGPEGISVKRGFEPGEGWALYQKQLSDLHWLLSELPVQEAHTADDLWTLRESGNVAAYVGCEGAHILEGNIERVQAMYGDGVRLIQLVHYAMNDLGDVQSLDPVYNGVTPFGADVVREMNRLGMIVDVAHASFDMVVQVAEVSSHPLVLSHSQLKIGDKQHPRLLEPEHAKAIAATGGVIGMWPSGFGNDTMQDFIDNTMRLIDLIGIEHVGLGTDMDGNYQPVFENYRQQPEWVAGLLAQGLSEDEIAKVIGGNALRVIEQVI